MNNAMNKNLATTPRIASLNETFIRLF